MNAVLVTKNDIDLDIYNSIDDSNLPDDSPFISELMCVFIDDENFTADEKAKDYITYVTDNNESYEVEDVTYPQYVIRHVRCY